MGDNGANARKNHRRRLFVKDGRPARFFLHPSIHIDSQRQKLRADIEAYGGRVASTDGRVDTVLISATYNKELLRFRYGADDDKHKRAIHVERLSFIQHCIQHKKFEHRVPIVKGMGGRPGRRQATEYTSSDDEHLCKYIARMQPRKEAGGRSGNQLYIQLVELGNKYPEYYAWTRRHTFHSWRERYKKKQHTFDPIIERIAKEEGTYDKPLWKEDRGMSRRRLRTGRHLEHNSSEEEEEEEEGEEGAEEGGEGGGEEDQLREEQEEEEGEHSPQPEDGHIWDGDEYGQEIEIPDVESEDPQVQDVDVHRSEIKKRKRVQPSTVPGHIAKKRRSNISVSYPAKAKGKGIAHESDHRSDSNNEIANTSLFSIDVDEEASSADDEPGPSNVLQSPDRSLVDLPSTFIHQQMNLTQETLVNTQSRMEFEPASHSTSANRRHSGHTSRSRPISHVKEDQEQGLPRPPPVRRVSPGTSRGLQDAPSNPEATNQLVSTGPKPRSKQKASSAIIQSSDAPYRNTRARSRSVEPVAMPPPTFKASRRGKQKFAAAERDVRTEALAGSPIETIEEEDVEHILMTKDANLSAAISPRDPSLETDDAQTRQNLRAASTVSGKPPAGTAFLPNRIKALEVLGKFESSSSSRRYSAPFSRRDPTQNDPALDENRRPRRSEPQIGFGTSKLPEPHTPMNVHRTRLESISSVGSFPLKGTRASAAKKERQEKEKHTPYKPPEGTRAAQFARSR